jgi:hypothetical protein
VPGFIPAAFLEKGATQSRLFFCDLPGIAVASIFSKQVVLALQETPLNFQAVIAWHCTKLKTIGQALGYAPEENQ